jgi:hypothetical protein
MQKTKGDNAMNNNEAIAMVMAYLAELSTCKETDTFHVPSIVVHDGEQVLHRSSLFHILEAIEIRGFIEFSGDGYDWFTLTPCFYDLLNKFEKMRD